MQNLSDEEENNFEKENESVGLKTINQGDPNYNNDNKESINIDNKPKEKNKNISINIRIIISAFFILLIILIFILLFNQLSKKFDLTKIKIKYNLRNDMNNNSSSANNKIGNITKINEEKNRKIGLAFIYSTLYSNGIARFITVTSKYLLRTGRYNIFFITDKPYYKEFSYEPEIKRFIAHNNYTLMRNISKYEKIDIVVLQNVCSTSVVNFHKKLGQKVICIYHGVFMSAMYSSSVTSYKFWDQFDSCDSFIFISPDDYFFYKKLGFKNAIFMPNLYTFEPSEVKSSNLTNHNILILGRLNDLIKGVKYAVQAMQYIVKEVPDATLYLVSSDSRVQFLKNLTRDLNLTNNIIFSGNTYNLTELFGNCSVHMYTSLSEAFPMALNEGKAHGMPVVGFKVPYSIPYQQGFIGVDIFDVKGLARETIKLLKDYDYRKRKGKEAKKSLKILKNNDTVQLWGRLVDSLLSNDREDYRRFQEEMEKKYYNETRAREHLESQFNILVKHEINLTCHSFDNFTDINYIKNIKACNMSEIYNNSTQK